MKLEARVRTGVLIGLTLTILAVAAWILMPVPSLLRALWVALITLPLWIFIPALRRGERRKYAALTLALVPYLVLALTEVIANPAARVSASAILMLAFGVFVLAIVYLRVTRAAPPTIGTEQPASD